MSFQVLAGPHRLIAIIVWLCVVAIATALVARARYAADLTAFLPRSPTPAQQLLVDQLRDGVVSRLILVGIEGAQPNELATLSKALRERLRTDAQFVAVHNGEPEPLDADRKYLFEHRYLLSDSVDAAFFESSSLRQKLAESLDQLASSGGLLSKDLVRSDPTGEMMRLIDRFTGRSQPRSIAGVWFSQDQSTAMAVLQTRAAGFDIDAQESAIGAIRAAFADAKQSANIANAKLILTGPGVFSVSTRATIKGDAIRFSTIATVLVTVLLLAMFRSPRVLALGLMPLITGALCGIAAVSLAFGQVHGITLGFGATLIGEAVDYAIYLFMQTEKTKGAAHTLSRIWPTLRLGVLTSIVGFSAMLLSGFPGLSQLGLFSMTGLIAAVLVTRYVLPGLMPRDFEVAERTTLTRFIVRMFRALARLRWIIVAISIASIALLWRTDPLWSDQLASLSPVPMADQMTDERLRREVGASDVRHLVVVRGASLDDVLAKCERIETALSAGIAKGALASYDSPSRYLPSARSQRKRQQSIPERNIMESRLSSAVDGLPFRANAFAPFIDDLEKTRRAPTIDRAALDGTQIALKFDSLTLHRRDEWFGMMPLSGVTDIQAVADATQSLQDANIVLLDTKLESDQLYASYRHEAAWLSAAGAIAIGILLLASMRSIKRLVAICFPLGAAVAVTLGALVLIGHTLSIFHLVGILLVVAVGSNYALFFDAAAVASVENDRIALSLALANLTTVLGFGLLGLSSVPVLAAIGATVGIGAFLSLIFAAALARVRPSEV